MAYDETPKMLVLLDGHAVNVVLYAGVQWPTLPLNREDIEKIEIVRGTASSIYGTDALVGITNIITKEVTNNSSTIHDQYGERGTQEYFYGLQHVFSNKFKLVFKTGYIKTENLGDRETHNAVNAAPKFMRGTVWVSIRDLKIPVVNFM